MRPRSPAPAPIMSDRVAGASGEREFGRLTNDWALSPLRIRGLDRVRLHADLTILAKLAYTLARTRAAPLAA